MDILIKNMEMPKNCGECPFYHLERVWHKGQYAYKCDAQLICELTDESEPKKLADACPLVALPSHGRLIDADELEASDAILIGEEAWNMVHNAPTIVEAST